MAKYSRRLRHGVVLRPQEYTAIYPDFESDNWFGTFVPAATPKDIVSKLHGLAVETLKSPEMRDF